MGGWVWCVGCWHPCPMHLFFTHKPLRGTIHTRTHNAAEPLGCPILALGSEQDARVPAEETQEWAKLTAAEFEYRIFPGGHFYLKPLEKEVIAHISTIVFKDPVGHTAHAMPGFILFDPNAKN